MKIASISYFRPVKDYTDNKINKNNPPMQNQIAQNSVSKMFAYQDFNISFAGRTPEDFYAQDFNRENMPKAMKTYLNYDYEQRQHIPPEQMMGEVFKHLDKAKNLMDVKNIYPHEVEPLFDNLHPNNIKSKKGILSEIKVARDLSDTPLLKDGSDDFGLYLLKKIYKEGKTLKEISKDFLEKDINEEYKGFITAPIDYSTTSAYGIKFPNHAFWHSFISTRDDYKAFFVTLPKNTVDPNRIVAAESNSKTTSRNSSKSDAVENSEKPKQQRKYTIKKYQKDQLAGDIKDAKGDIEGIKRKVVKRFRKDDPEASFIVKYLSPIMTVAAERVHLSEEMKYFTEDERLNGKSIQGRFMFERFWKANPHILNDYSKAIVDTIEMFEERYGAGGMVPINKEFEPINSNTENQKAIDYVTPDFIELLDYTKEIEPLRNEKYAKHDELQKQWEDHFMERYGDPFAVESVEEDVIPETDDLDEELAGVKELNPDFETALKASADKYNAGVYSLNGINGEDIRITGNLNETFRDYLRDEIKLFPSAYAALYTKSMLANDEISDKFKLSLATRNIKDMIDDPQIMSDDEFYDEFNTIHYLFYVYHAKAEMAASAAMADILVKEAPTEVTNSIYRLYTHEYNDMLNGEKSLNDFVTKAFATNKTELDRLYNEYQKPLSSTEVNKITLAIFDQISKYNPNYNDSILDSDVKEIMVMLKEVFAQHKCKKIFIRDALKYLLPEYPVSRCLLNKQLDSEHRIGRFEQIINLLLRDMLSGKIVEGQMLITALGNRVLEEHKANLSPECYKNLQQLVSQLDPTAKQIYELSERDLDIFDRNYKKTRMFVK